MNRFTISICALLLATACGLTAAEMVGKNATTDRIAEDLVFGSGRTLTIESGATLLIAAGATANFSLATVTLPVAVSLLGQSIDLGSEIIGNLPFANVTFTGNGSQLVAGNGSLLVAGGNVTIANGTISASGADLADVLTISGNLDELASAPLAHTARVNLGLSDVSAHAGVLYTSIFPQILPYITGLTGGGAADLDGIPTVDLGAGGSTIAIIILDGVAKVYQLKFSVEAEASPGFIRPDDFEQFDNQKVWRQIQ